MKEFKNLSSAELDQVVMLYSSSFLPVETKPIETVLAMLKQDSNYFLYAALKDESLAAFSLVYIFHDLQTALLDYMVVHPSLQRRGIGKILFGHTLNLFERKIKEPIGLLLEIQNETLAHDAKDRIIRIDRLAFYKKLGAKVITDRYLLPPQFGSEPEQTYLMIVPFIKDVSFSRELILRYVKEIHSRVYHYHSDELIRRIGESIPANIILKDIEI